MCHQMYGVSCIIERLQSSPGQEECRGAPHPPTCAKPSPHPHCLTDTVAGLVRAGQLLHSRHRLQAQQLLHGCRLFSLGGTSLEASGRLRRTGRPRYRHPLSLALSLNPPILLLSRLPFTQGAPGQGRQRLRGHGWCDLPGSGRRAGKGRRRREGGRRSQLNLDANHNLRSKQGSKTVFPHPYTFDI